jgi:hypothetical protein
MNSGAATDPHASEQARYARWLEFGTWLGLVLLVASFAAYVLGWLPAHVSPQRLSQLWGQPLKAYLAATGTPTGWGWWGLLPRADTLGLLGIAWLAGVSVPCLLALVPLYLRRGDKAFAALCLAVVAVLLLAASGLLSGGH